MYLAAISALEQRFIYGRLGCEVLACTAREMYGIGGLMNSGMILYGAQQWPAFLIGYF
jgi:hypothetical protein